MSFFSVTNSKPPALCAGQVVAYEYLHNGEHWQWTLGSVVAVQRHVAVVEQWTVNEGNCETLKTNVSSEVQKEMKRLGTFQEQLSAARDKLAAIRSENEDRVSAARADFEEAKLRVANVDEVHMREVTSQMCPSPVAVEVLKSVLALAQNDPTVANCLSWDDIRLEFRRPNAIMDFISADIGSKVYPAMDSIYSSFEDLNLSPATPQDSEAIASLYQWVLCALAYQKAHSRLTGDTRVQEQNDAIANCIAGMKACRLKIIKLKEELEHGGTITLGGQITSFTKTSVRVKIPLSSIISLVPVDPSMQNCVLTDDEVNSILGDAEEIRFQIKERLLLMINNYMEAAAELHCLSTYTNELEERRLYLQERHISNLLLSRDSSSVVTHDDRVASDVKELYDIINDLESHDERWTYKNEPTVTTKHQKSYPGKDWGRVIERKPEELLTSFRSEQALACHLPKDAIQNVQFKATSIGLQVAFDVQHSAKQTTREINHRLQQFPPREMDRLLRDVDGPKKDLDRAIIEVCRAFDLGESAYRGMSFDQFIEEVSKRNRVGDKDAYESEIGDLLLLLDKIHSENRSLQYTLEKSAEEFRRQTASTMREQEALKQRNDELNAEIARLRGLVEKLRELADNQASELDLYKLQKSQANQLRAQRNLSDFKGDDTGDPVYCVTLDELHEQMDHCEQLERELMRHRDQLQNLLRTHDDVLAELSYVTGEKSKLEAECERLKNELCRAEEGIGILEQRLDDTTRELNESQAEVDDLRTKIGLLTQELGHLEVSQKEAMATIEEGQREIDDLKRMLAEQADENDQLANRLEEQRRHSSELEKALRKQEEELSAYRKKRYTAHQTRSLEPTLRPIAHRSTSPDERSNPEVIASEPVLSVTLDEYTDQRHRCIQFQQENDLLRQQLQQAIDERDNLRDRQEQLCEENQGLSEQLHRKHEELEREEKENKSLSLKNEKLNKELQQQQKENERLTSENNKLRGQISTLNVQLKEMSEECAHEKRKLK
ncbi:flagellar attachment zone protein, partial [Trypanosoma vivax Y486]